MSLVKISLVAVFSLILVSLAYGFVTLFKTNEKRGDETVKALTVRVILSFTLLIVIGVLYLLGILSPNN